jgi:light-regulated signal transduction histidine kinase (bacteriophytochrome)
MSDHREIRRLLLRASLLPVVLMTAVVGVLLAQVLTIFPLAGPEAQRGIALALVTTGGIAVTVLTVLAVLSRREELRLAKAWDDAVAEAARVRAEELERLVADRTRDLLALNRELESFSYAVSHDLRAPLRAIAGFSEALEGDHSAALDPDARVLLARIRGATARMGHLVEALLGLAKVARTELRDEDVDLSALAREVAAELREREGPRRLEILVQEGVRGRGDPRLLRDALQNLLENALKFTRKTSAGRVEFATIEGPSGRTYLVRDNGAGFDMAYAARLFAPFQRLHPPEEFDGSGVGLATVQRIIHRHGGRIWAEAAPGQGATFYFTLAGGSAR